jgi:hypothetical protein
MEEIIPGATKATSDINAHNVAPAETRFYQATPEEEPAMPSTTDQKFDITIVFERRVLNSSVIVVNPWVFGKILDFFRPNVDVLTEAGLGDALVALLIVSLKQLLLIVVRDWPLRHCDSIEL